MDGVLKYQEVSPRTTNVASADPKKESQSAPPLVIIESRNLIRECLTRCLRELNTPDPVLAFAALTDWRDVSEHYPAPSLIIICVNGQTRPKAEVVQDVALAAETSKTAPVVLFTDGEDAGQILEALNAGARGVVPASLSLEVANQALRLVKAGGTFVPANALCAPRDIPGEAGLKREGGGIFTVRQTAVVEKLAQGKANKIIAYELAMCESTVKVHVRTIMRKLRATNRTHAAYLYQSMKAA